MLSTRAVALSDGALHEPPEALLLLVSLGPAVSSLQGTVPVDRKDGSMQLREKATISRTRNGSLDLLFLHAARSCHVISQLVHQDHSLSVIIPSEVLVQGIHDFVVTPEGFSNVGGHVDADLRVLILSESRARRQFEV